MFQKPKNKYRSKKAECKKRFIKKIKKSPKQKEMLGRYVEKKYKILLSQVMNENDYDSLQKVG